MSMFRDRLHGFTVRGVFLLTGMVSMFQVAPSLAEIPGAAAGATAPAAILSGAGVGMGQVAPVAPCHTSELGSPYIPLDSWMYPSLSRLYSLGYLDLAFQGLRPWTRSSVIHMLEETSAQLEDAPDNASTDEARTLYDALWHELNIDAEGPCFRHRGQVRVESVYQLARGISGTPLHDSYHIGETITNDYGRPYEGGFNSYSGVSGY